MRSAILEFDPLRREVLIRQYCTPDSDNPGVLAERFVHVEWSAFIAARHLGVLVELRALRPTRISEYVLSFRSEKILARYERQESPLSVVE